MRNVADQLFILFVELNLFLRRLFQPDAHLLEVLAEIIDLCHTTRLHGKVKISVFDVLRRLLQLSERADHTAVNPKAQAKAGEHQNQNRHNSKFSCHTRNLRRNLICLGYDKRTAFFSVHVLIVHLFDHPLFFISEINTALGIGAWIAVFRQLIFQFLRRQLCRSVVNDGSVFTHRNKRLFFLQSRIQNGEIIRFFQPRGIRFCGLLHLVVLFCCHRIQKQRIVRNGSVRCVCETIFFTNALRLIPYKKVKRQGAHHNRNQYDDEKRNDDSRP